MKRMKPIKFILLLGSAIYLFFIISRFWGGALYIPFTGNIFMLGSDTVRLFQITDDGKELSWLMEVDAENTYWTQTHGADAIDAERIISSVNDVRYAFWLPNLSWLTGKPEFSWSIGWNETGVAISEDCKWLKYFGVIYYLRSDSVKELQRLQQLVAESG